MNAEQSQWWEKLQAFQFDAPDAQITLAEKLARENGWTATYADRVLEEYRRYLLLFKCSGHGVSPSEAVDLAWHAHLLYTRSYWQELCGRVLGQPLHHEPSTGADDGAKFDDWYLATLASYRKIFGEEPPADIWPAPERRDDVAPFARKIDTRKFWIIPRSRLVAAAVLTALAIFGAAVLSGCRPVAMWPAVAITNPLNFRGPDFLNFYIITSTFVLSSAVLLRMLLRGPNDLPAGLKPLDLYEAAYLFGGPAIAIRAAVAKLASEGELLVNRGRGTVTRVGDRTHAKHSFEIAVFTALRIPTSFQTLAACVRPQVSRIEGRLRDQKLVLDTYRSASIRAIAAMIVLTLPVLGVTKICVGISRNRPVGFLVVLTFIATLLGMAVCALPIRRTFRGERVLRAIRREHSHARFVRKSAPPDMVGLAVALFGMTALSDEHPLRHMDRLPPTERSSWGSGCSSSSCGGGGSSCGGGGGSGCGGCSSGH